MDREKPRTATEGRIRSFARRRFGKEVRCVPLAGDASDRSFYRLGLPGLSPLVAMVHPEPFHLEDLPYFAVGRFLKEIGAPVPEIIGSYPGEGVLLLQDLGDETLMEALSCAPSERARFLYKQAVQIIVFLQTEGTRSLPPDLPCARAALDRERLLFELRFFAEHYIEGLLGSGLAGEQPAILDKWFEDLAERVSGYEQVLCHRDFHSRNLILRGSRLYMVDFQDARLGPYTYDLASLLHDSYVDVPERVREEAIACFLESSARSGQGNGSPSSFFREEFEWTCLQRNIKALGTFAFQAVVRGNRRYLADVSRTLELIRFNLARRGEAEILELFQGPLLLP
jgi:aminoglycoside/choline kinase family phosphotransferase